MLYFMGFRLLHRSPLAGVAGGGGFGPGRLACPASFLGFGSQTKITTIYIYIYTHTHIHIYVYAYITIVF